MDYKRGSIAFIVLIFILFITRNFHESYRLFIFYTPIFIGILYFNLRQYYSKYAVIRFSQNKKWQGKVILIIFQCSAIAAIVLCIDKLFIVNNYMDSLQLGPLYLEYCLFLSIVSIVTITPTLSVRRGIIFSIVIIIFARSRIELFKFLGALHDSRKFTLENGILESMIYLFVINIILYIIYFVWTKVRGKKYGYG